MGHVPSDTHISKPRTKVGLRKWCHGQIIWWSWCFALVIKFHYISCPAGKLSASTYSFGNRCSFEILIHVTNVYDITENLHISCFWGWKIWSLNHSNFLVREFATFTGRFKWQKRPKVNFSSRMSQRNQSPHHILANSIETTEVLISPIISKSYMTSVSVHGISRIWFSRRQTQDKVSYLSRLPFLYAVNS